MTIVCLWQKLVLAVLYCIYLFTIGTADNTISGRTDGECYIVGAYAEGEPEEVSNYNILCQH